MRVLYFYPDSGFGPALSVFGLVLAGLPRDRFEAHLAINRLAPGPLPVNSDSSIVVRRDFGDGIGRGSPLQRARSLAKLSAATCRVAVAARRERIDVVHCAATPYTSPLGWFVARLAGARLLLHVHALWRHAGRLSEKTLLRSLLQKIVLRRADAVVGVSQFVTRDALGAGVSPAKIHVVLNGVDVHRFRPGMAPTGVREGYGLPGGAPLFLQLGRVVEYKRQSDFVRALAIARRHVPQVRGLIVGWDDRNEDGREGCKRDIARICEEEGVADIVTFGDARPDVPELLSAVDVVVMPSVDDAMPLTVLEAMAAAKPVIGASSGGIPELVVDGATGFLVPPRSPSALAEKIVVLARDEELRRQMGTRARARAVSAFDQRRLAREFARIYERLLAEASTAST